MGFLIIFLATKNNVYYRWYIVSIIFYTLCFEGCINKAKRLHDNDDAVRLFIYDFLSFSFFRGLLIFFYYYYSQPSFFFFLFHDVMFYEVSFSWFLFSFLWAGTSTGVGESRRHIFPGVFLISFLWCSFGSVCGGLIPSPLILGDCT